MGFVATKFLTQKSLKIELLLKSYIFFKFQGLDCKIAGLDCIKNLNLRIDLNLGEK
jgi:hypothetical protein